MMQENFDVWWKGIPALPASREEQAYFALRRVWADQTINTRLGARGFYRWRTEDYVTPSLWQNWSIFEECNALASFLRTAGAPVGSLKKARWAYACEELTGVGRSFVIPDIMVSYEDEAGVGLLAIEAKKPGTPAKPEDARKLKQYCDLPSTRSIGRRHGCFLVGADAAAATRINTGGPFPIVTWQALADSQIGAARSLKIGPLGADLVCNWLARAFARQGVAKPVPAPAPQAGGYGCPESYDAIRGLRLPLPIELFVMGSECVEASWQGNVPEPPMPWLAREPGMTKVCQPGFQSTADRRVCRWLFDWHPRLEIT